MNRMITESTVSCLLRKQHIDTEDVFCTENGILSIINIDTGKSNPAKSMKQWLNICSDR